MYESVISQNALVIPELNFLVPKILLEEASGFVSQECHIKATNDLAAINVWLVKHKTNLKTYTAYKREVERLLLWCIYVRGLTLAQLKVEDFTAYFEFLKKPPKNWCITRKELRKGRRNTDWRPFLGALSQAGFNLAVRILNSMMNFLVTANYLRFNPIKLTHKPKDFAQTLESQKYHVWARMLEDDEWQAIQEALESMPEGNEKQIGHKIRTQLLFAMLYFLGLRIHELAGHTWNAFRYREGRWYFFVKGKGNKLAHIPVHDQLLSFVKIYRIHLGKNPLPEANDTDSLLVSKYSKKPLSIRQTFSLVKDIGKVAAQQFVENPPKQQKLLQLSPHWLRHLLASHLDKAKVPAIMIQSILRHNSLDVTNIYMHAEESLKYQEIQKLVMNLNPKLPEIELPLEVFNLKLGISLTKGPVCNEFSLLKLLDTIEQIVLEGHSWEVQGSRELLLEKYKKLYLYKQPFVITYDIYNIKKGVVKVISSSVIHEANIRLFDCEIVTSFN